MILTRGHDIRPDHNDILHSRLHTVEDAFTKGARARARRPAAPHMAHGAVYTCLTRGEHVLTSRKTLSDVLLGQKPRHARVTTHDMASPWSEPSRGRPLAPTCNAKLLVFFGVPTHPLDASPKVQILRRLLRQQEAVVVVIGQVSIG